VHDRDNESQRPTIMSNQERVFVIICASLIIFTLYYLADKHLF